MILGGRISDLCNGCFVGDFALLGVVCVGVVDLTCVFLWITKKKKKKKRKELKRAVLATIEWITSEFDLYGDIVLIMYIFCAKILFKGLM